MWDCMLVGDVSCIPFFLATVVIGNLVVSISKPYDGFVFFCTANFPEPKKNISIENSEPFTQVLNLFLALLLSNFGSSSLSQPNADNDTNKIAEAFNRISRFKNWIKQNIANGFKFLRNKLTNQISDQPPGERTNHISWIWNEGFYPLVFISKINVYLLLEHVIPCCCNSIRNFGFFFCFIIFSLCNLLICS